MEFIVIMFNRTCLIDLTQKIQSIEISNFVGSSFIDAINYDEFIYLKKCEKSINLKQDPLQVNNYPDLIIITINMIIRKTKMNLKIIFWF